MEDLIKLESVNQDEQVHLIPESNLKLPVIVRDSRSGQITIYQMDDMSTISDLKHMIIIDSDVLTVESIQIMLFGKEIADSMPLTAFENDMKLHPLNLVIRQPQVSTERESSVKPARKSLLPPLQSPCIGCSKIAFTHCSICGHAVCEDCGNWETSIMRTTSTYAIQRSPSMEDIERQQKKIVLLTPAMRFFTQCPQCRASRARVEVNQRHVFVHTLESMRRSKLLGAAIITTLIVAIVIFLCI